MSPRGGRWLSDATWRMQFCGFAIRMLEDDHGYDVESVAHKGDSVESMAYGGQLEKFTRLIEKLLRQSGARIPR